MALFSTSCGDHLSGVPIPGMDMIEYIDDNLKSIDVELTTEDLRVIDEEMSKISVQGARLDEGLLSMSDK